MASEQILRDHLGKKLGVIRVERDGRMRGYNRVGYKKGTYQPLRNRTYDRTGKFVGIGNLLAALIADF